MVLSEGNILDDLAPCYYRQGVRELDFVGVFASTVTGRTRNSQPEMQCLPPLHK